MIDFFKRFKQSELYRKLKNPYFIVGLIGMMTAILNSAGIDFNTLTNWAALGNAILDILNNPVALVGSILTVIAMYNDNSTPGIDKVKVPKKLKKVRNMPELIEMEELLDIQPLEEQSIPDYSDNFDPDDDM